MQHFRRRRAGAAIRCASAIDQREMARSVALASFFKSQGSYVLALSAPEILARYHARASQRVDAAAQLERADGVGQPIPKGLAIATAKSPSWSSSET
jgi:hypothetical protein